MRYFVYIIIYAWTSYTVFLIARRANQENLWLSFVPFGREWLLVKVANKSWKWFLFIFIPIINIWSCAVIWMGVAKQAGRNKWLGLLMVLPFINLFTLYWMAFPNMSWNLVWKNIVKFLMFIKMKFVKNI